MMNYEEIFVTVETDSGHTPGNISFTYLLGQVRRNVLKEIGY
jgi:hypothetical protein